MEPLGQSQIVSYLTRLAKNYNITIVSYEKSYCWSKKINRVHLINVISKVGIKWIPLRYHVRPTLIVTLYDIIIGLLLCSYLIIKFRINIIHVRSYLPALIGFIIKKFFSTKIIFDMRGFWVDERVDGKIWERNSLLYFIGKIIEKYLLDKADKIITLTKVSIAHIIFMAKDNYIERKICVIPTCVNTEKFSLKPIKTYDTNNINFGYIGSLTDWYDIESLFEFMKNLEYLHKKYSFEFITNDNTSKIQNLINKYSLSNSKIYISRSSFSQIPHVIKNLDVGIFFTKNVYSRQASFPTRVAEFLSSGVPCITNYGVGDHPDILLNTNTGVIINKFSDNDYIKAINAIYELRNDPFISERCRKVAIDSFSIEYGVDKYSQVYNSLING